MSIVIATRSRGADCPSVQVFSISRNRIHKIPPYFVQFRDLVTFKADQNPLEWPPKDVMEAPHTEQGDDMKAWIRDVQAWIEENTSTSEKKLLEESSIAEQDSESVLDTIL